MQRLVRIVLLSAVSGFLGVSVACKEEEKKPAKKQGSENATPSLPQGPVSPVGPASPSPDPSPSPSPSSGKKDDCKKTKDSSSKDSSAKDSDKEFGLLASKVYFTDIKAVIKDKCLECHASDAESDKKKKPYLEKYSEVKSAKAKIATLVESSDKHPEDGTQLTKKEKEKITQWVEDGALEKEESSSDDDGGGSSGKDDCEGDGKDAKKDDDGKDGKDDDDDDGKDDNASAWEDLINPVKMKKCKEDDLLYDRAGEKCHRAKIATSYKCTRSDIIDRFKALNVNITSQMDQFDTEGYVIDQCGEYKDEPIVYFYKKGEESGDELKLQVRKICKKNSAACDNP